MQMQITSSKIATPVRYLLKYQVCKNNSWRWEVKLEIGRVEKGTQAKMSMKWIPFQSKMARFIIQCWTCQTSGATQKVCPAYFHSRLDVVSTGDALFSNSLILLLAIANGHITLNTPVLVRSLKLSSVEPSQYLDG